MSFDLRNFSEDDLVELNRCVIQRLRELRDLRANTHMQNFSIGDRVMFHPEGRDPVYGTLVKFNRKSVTVISEDRTRWTVAPSFLSRVEASSPSCAGLTTHSNPFQLALVKNSDL